MTKPKFTDEPPRAKASGSGPLGAASLSAGLSRAGGMLRNLGLRILVHLASAGTALALALSRFTPEGGGISAFFSFYFGFICLVPGGMALSAAWCVPVLSGVVQAVLLGVLGLPLHVAVFWGGFQVWTQRMLQKGGRMGSEWIAAVFLLPLGVHLVANYPHFALASLPILAVAGWRLEAEYRRRRLAPEYRRMMYRSIENLKKLLDAEKLPQALSQPVRDFIRLGLPYLENNGRLSEQAVLALHGVKNLAARTEAMLPAGASFPVQPAREDAEAVLLQLQPLNDEFRRDLAGREATALELPRSLADYKDSDLMLARFRGFVAVLSMQKHVLPQPQQERVEGICRAAEGIMECMGTSADCMQQGGKFLQRYLKAAHKVVSEQDRLEAGNGLAESSGDILSRLEEAFKAEEVYLKQKDAREFGVDLKMIDVLLKMDGH